MENAAEALKMAFAVFVFVIALTSVFSLISQARSTADVIFAMHDRDISFYDDLEGITNLDSSQFDSHGNRVVRRTVGWSTVVPTIYRYGIENYGVTIIDTTKSGDEQIVARFSEKSEGIAQSYFDYNNTDDQLNYIKKHIDYLNNNILNIENCSYKIKEYTKNQTEDGTLYKLFKRIYNLTNSNLNTFGAPWLRDDNAIKKRLDGDLGKEKIKINFAVNGDTYESLGLRGINGCKENAEFIEYFVTVPPQNTNDEETFEIIYVVK